MAHVAVVGAGVVGVATAYMLCKAGHSVTLVDRNPGPAMAASRRNGAQLSYAYCDALASPSLLRHLPGIALGRDPAFRVNLQADPDFLAWGLRFVINTLPARFAANTVALSRMAADTREVLAQVLAEFSIPFDYAVSGKMILYPTDAKARKAVGLQKLKQQVGLTLDMLDRDEATAIEPALQRYPDPIARVAHSPGDATGRPDSFCAELVRALSDEYGLQTIFGHEVARIRRHRGRATGLAFRDREPLDCDTTVLATGAATDLLPWRDRSVGGLWPVQGYSWTVGANFASMRVSITDMKRKLVFARLGDQVRIAGLADIGARNPTFDQRRYITLQNTASEAFPGAFDTGMGDKSQPWSGARPCTPSSRPVIRPSALSGVYLNYGHGTLGWTLCFGAARRLVEQIAG